MISPILCGSLGRCFVLPAALGVCSEFGICDVQVSVEAGVWVPSSLEFHSFTHPGAIGE